MSQEVFVERKIGKHFKVQQIHSFTGANKTYNIDVFYSYAGKYLIDHKTHYGFGIDSHVLESLVAELWNKYKNEIKHADTGYEVKRRNSQFNLFRSNLPTDENKIIVSATVESAGELKKFLRNLEEAMIKYEEGIA